jgi:hypothetical protein
LDSSLRLGRAANNRVESMSVFHNNTRSEVGQTRGTLDLGPEDSFKPEIQPGMDQDSIFESLGI